jgi:hypothetical protein
MLPVAVSHLIGDMWDVDAERRPHFSHVLKVLSVAMSEESGSFPSDNDSALESDTPILSSSE